MRSSAASEVFSRPREAMSSTKDGRVVIATARRPEGNPREDARAHGYYNGLQHLGNRTGGKALVAMG